MTSCICTDDILQPNPMCAIHGTAPAIERQRKSGRLHQFDSQTSVITIIRGADYGPPRADFERVQAVAAALGLDGVKCSAVRHVLYMLVVKLVRLRNTPTHLDSWIDVAGYARCGVMVTDDLLPGGARFKSAETVKA